MRHNAGLSNAKCFALTRHASLVTYHSPGAVSSVVEHLVYTEGVGGSKPSPPSLFSILDCQLAIYLAS